MIKRPDRIGRRREVAYVFSKNFTNLLNNVGHISRIVCIQIPV